MRAKDWQNTCQKLSTWTIKEENIEVWGRPEKTTMQENKKVPIRKVFTYTKGKVYLK